MVEPVPRWVLRVAVAVALAALVGWSCWQRWQVLGASPFPLGVDGYFYPIQLRSLLDHGTLQYPASPLAFWFMAPFAAATDPIVGAKLGAALGGAMIAVPAYGVGARLGRGRGPGLIAAALATASGGSAYLSIEFVKQGIGLTVALTALWLVLRAVERPTRGRVIAMIAGVVAALLAHKMAAAIVVGVGVPAAIAEARGRGALRGRRLIYVVLGAIAFGVTAIVLGLVFPQRFLSASDLALVRDAVTSHARWDAPALATPHLVLAFGHDALIGGGLAMLALIALIVQRSAAIRVRVAPGSLGVLAASWIVIALALVIAVPWLAVDDPQGLGFRLRIAAFVPMALCGAIVAPVAFAWLRGLPRDGVLAVIAIVLCGRPIDRTEGRVLAHPALVAAAAALDGQVPSNATVIVPERHIAFMVAWYAHAPISLRPDTVPYPQRVRVMPLAFIGAGSPLDDALDAARRELTVASPIGLHPRHRNGLVLVAEPTWDWILAQLPPRARAHFAAWPTI